MLIQRTENDKEINFLQMIYNEFMAYITTSSKSIILDETEINLEDNLLHSTINNSQIRHISQPIDGMTMER